MASRKELEEKIFKLRKDAQEVCKDIYGDYSPNEIRKQCPPSVQLAWDIGWKLKSAENEWVELYGEKY